MTGDSELGEWLSERGVPALPYTDGKPRFRAAPCFVPSRRLKALRTAAAAVSRAYDNLCDILARDPSHLTGYFSLTPLQKMLWYSSGSLWNGIARADIFCTKDGTLAVAEVNSDTPSGVDEAFLLGEFAESKFPEYVNPNRGLRDGFLSVIRRAYEGLLPRSGVPTVALVYPTDIPEDQGMIFLYRSWLEEAGYRVLLGSPSNVECGGNGRALLFGSEIDVLFRHYKTDWWCERTNVWKDARRIPDAGPLLHELQNVIGPMTECRLAVVNPFGAVVTQNKLSLAFFHEMIHLFNPDSQETIRKYIPLTKRLRSFEPGTLEREKDDWVLKSDYGCEGAEVIVGRLTGAEAWTNALHLAEPAHWVAQRYFQAEVLDSGLIENYGVYTTGGEPAGLYVRLSKGVTGTTSIVAPAIERPPLAGAVPRIVPPRVSQGLCDPRVRALMRAYAPCDRWLPFRMSLLLHSAAEADFVPRLEVTPEVKEACATGEALAGLIKEAEEDVRKSVLVVSDLDGPASVALSAHVAPAADIVLQIENIAHAHESVPLRETLGALVHFAPEVSEQQGRHAREEERSAAFILDRRRMDPPRGGPGEFNNRHWAYMPTIRVLEELGIGTILYIHPDGTDTESDDLNEDFVQYAGAGIRLCYASPGLIRSSSTAGIAQILSLTARVPGRRETVFTYMLPPGDGQKSYTYNQEAALA